MSKKSAEVAKASAVAPAAAPAKSITVRALRNGEWPSGKWHQKGDVFTFPADKKLGKWMEVVPDGTKPPAISSSPYPTPIALSELAAAQSAPGKKIQDIGGPQ